MKGYIDAVDALIKALAELPDHHKLSLEEEGVSELITKIAEARPREASPGEREAAHDEYATDDIEVDDTAYISEACDGYWVSGWLWVAAPEEDEDGE